MPIYEYKIDSETCAQCGDHFSDLQKLSDPPHTHCPECQKPCHRIPTMAAIPGKKPAFVSIKARQTETDRGTANHEHNHDCRAAGCYGRAEKLLKK